MRTSPRLLPFRDERLCDVRLEASICRRGCVAILGAMRGDAVGAGFDRNLRRLHGIRVSSAAGVADGGDVVDVDAEAKGVSGHSCNRSCRPRPSTLSGSALSSFVEERRRKPHLSIHPLGVCHTPSRAIWRDNRVEMLEVKNLEIDVTEVKSAMSVHADMSILPSCSAMTWATWAATQVR